VTTTHIFPILYGAEGRNGKDTLLGTLKAVLGSHVGAVSKDVFIAQGKKHAAGAATPHLCDLQGKRLVWGSETEEGERLNVAQLKDLTGEGEISTRQLQGHQYAFPPTHKIFLMTNYKPQANARDKAFWARACLIEFGIRFVDDPRDAHERPPDKNLKEALRQEGSGILAWLVRGCLAWQTQGLDIPASVQLATNKYREGEDKLLLFIQERCMVAENAYVKAQTLYNAYHDWYESNRFDGSHLNGTLFGDEISKRFQKKHTKVGRIYQGIGILTEEPNQETLFSDTDDGEG
jgi:putative DNA primase/helicase